MDSSSFPVPTLAPSSTSLSWSSALVTASAAASSSMGTKVIGSLISLSDSDSTSISLATSIADAGHSVVLLALVVEVAVRGDAKEGDEDPLSRVCDGDEGEDEGEDAAEGDLREERDPKGSLESSA